MLPPIPLSILQQVVYMVLNLVFGAMGAEDSLTAHLLSGLAGEVISFFGIAVGVSALSMSFQVLTGFRPGMPAPTEDRAA